MTSKTLEHKNRWIGEKQAAAKNILHFFKNMNYLIVTFFKIFYIHVQFVYNIFLFVHYLSDYVHNYSKRKKSTFASKLGNVGDPDSDSYQF